MTRRDEWAGENLRALRAKRKLTQEHLALQTSLDRSVVNALEKGRREISPYYAEKLAAVLKVPASQLLPPAGLDEEQADSPLDRLAELEDGIAALGRVLDRLADRVEILEKQSKPRRRKDDSQGGAS